MSEPKESPVTKDHLHVFGGIIHLYASAETGIKLSLGGMLGIDVGATMIITEPYSSLNLRNVAKSLNRTIPLPNKSNEQLAGLVGRLKSYSVLRNNIAHSRWTYGNRKGAIKPIKMDIRSGKPVTRGMDPEEEDFTLEELWEKASNLERLNDDIGQFLKDSGLQEIIARKIEEARPETEESEGISNKDS